MSTLSGKVALVTGASKGIGRAVAERLAADGARVGVHYNSSEAAAKEVVNAIEAEGGQAFLVRAELGVDGDATALWAEFDKAADGLDILVNNAGAGLLAPIGHVQEADFDKLVAVNVKSLFFVIQQGLDRLRDGGRIINVSSATTRIAMPNVVAYSMTKGAMNTLTLTLAEALAPRGITVNAVAPGIIDTDFNPWLAHPQMRALAESWSAFGRTGTPADVAGVAGFLASPAGGWVSGQVIDVSGASSLGNGPAPKG
ncbi:3-oxoacyl-[acyl-carrier protein] reductase [Streptomyces africanus]|uniref:3-oxoacyl-[acyl-carrier protein] reductase n=1 Tax=Streptomyces africanus TaxID=231024 RepID=A0ABU0QWW9_9ACTN|nr:SDR family oxidoreductase [Streptomyces africanus]MDQ0751894.1 3-oxoacyl-[acyl-carrier protein] reductase [Streptomyces africanus]